MPNPGRGEPPHTPPTGTARSIAATPGAEFLPDIEMRITYDNGNDEIFHVPESVYVSLKTAFDSPGRRTVTFDDEASCRTVTLNLNTVYKIDTPAATTVWRLYTAATTARELIIDMCGGDGTECRPVAVRRSDIPEYGTFLRRYGLQSRPPDLLRRFAAALRGKGHDFKLDREVQGELPPQAPEGGLYED